jgi:hypothetical protein
MPAVTGSWAGRAAWLGDVLLVRGAGAAGTAAAAGGGASATDGKAAASSPAVAP